MGTYIWLWQPMKTTAQRRGRGWVIIIIQDIMSLCDTFRLWEAFITHCREKLPLFFKKTKSYRQLLMVWCWSELTQYMTRLARITVVNNTPKRHDSQNWLKLFFCTLFFLLSLYLMRSRMKLRTSFGHKFWTSLSNAIATGIVWNLR